MVLTHLRQAAEATVDDLQARAAQNEILSKIFHRDSSNARMLWGLLHIKIIKCVGLRNTDRVAGLVSTFTKGRIDKSDPYVEAYLDEYRLLKTRVIDDNLDPVFEEEFHCPVAHIGETITFRVKDKDVIKDESLGEYTLSVSDLVQTVTESDIHENPQDKLVPGDLKRVGLHKVVYLSSHPKKKEKYGTLEFMIEFIPTRLLPKSPEVPGIYFATTHRNDVKLYMNADDDGSAPIVKYGGIHNDEKVWTPPRLWRDIYDAICNAKHFIYVAGWSVDTDQYLLRGKELDVALGHGKYNPQIGELLKMKSDEGVIVNLMQWDDYSSNFAFPGMMKTYDEKTRNFFRNTKVNSRFMHMVGGETNTVLEGQNKKMAFTHHQKFIIMDAPKTDGSGGCELFAFIGGIDLTEGRWDNRQHPLFRTLQSLHKGDTYGKCFKVNYTEHGPRQPWHDIHSAVRGPEALHLVKAFEERWAKQADAGELVNLNRLGLDNAMSLSNAGGWCAQLSRSIDSRVNTFDPSVKELQSEKFICDGLVQWSDVDDSNATSSKRFESATFSDITFGRCLDLKKGRLVDNSIHMTNIHHIRRAKHFIYIESQYFMGSSFMWSNDRRVKCGNMIAAEIALKICEKVAAREPFAVYILLPMWMEGIPAAGATQGLLYWQRVTIEAMYQQVQEALNARMANSSDYGLQVSDYLNIYCLGTRETSAGSQTVKASETEDEIVLNKTRRHQIYIHSKMMIVDDDVVEIGTANINQRSMDGCRDSEIMMTAWQPDHLATKELTPNGDVHAYRMHIWASITGQIHEVFRYPSSPDCVQLMNKIAFDNWEKFNGDDTVDMTSHLLPFPLQFDGSKIQPVKGLVDGNFPDTKASVLGKKSMILPEIFLT